MAKPGDRVKITAKKGSEEGILMPSPDKDTLLLKLDSGYNVGFDQKEVSKITVLAKAAAKKKIVAKITKNPNLPTIAILHTGGTIASKVDYRTGGVASEFSPEELLSLFPELKDIANLESELIAQMWSDDLRFAHFSLIAKAIVR
ncbi:MAG: asparaginase domain-containing protein, partial [Nanoarchaeota archaeon]